jgi:predicted CoA-substrate-specific enzyme activase
MEGVTCCLPVNEVVATARGVRQDFPKARTVIDLGGQSTKWILLGLEGEQDAVMDFLGNGLCAAGAGAFLEQQADRLGMTVAELGRIAAGAARGATIAGRCSVFAKSDMIHLQQKGTPSEEVAYGLCQAMVRTFIATTLQGRKIEPPVVLAGGGAANPGLVRAFREQLALDDGQFTSSENSPFFGALGAASLAGQAPLSGLQEFLVALMERETATSHLDRPVLPPLPPEPPTSSPDAEDVAPVAGNVKAFLGLDVGSVSTNLVLLSPDNEVLHGIYLPTRGRPVEALHEGLKRIRERFGSRLQVLGVGSTGSGRHLAAEVVGADVVHNEITAQMVSSLVFMPEADTIFEIGGQDSKYISVRDGRLADFEMNKICAGGTGSFLEEQSGRLGVRIAGEFSSLALRAAHPCDLGARCTVFMDTEVVRAQERGATLEDLCAGLAYSVARNYLEKVVAGRHVGRCIVFQGGTASNRAVVAAFRQLLGRPVVVHPYNRISGAIGAALLAARARPERSRFLGLDACAGAEVRSFECRRCENRCQVNRIKAGTRVSHFGDICERYAERDREAKSITRPFPELFAAREQLFREHLRLARRGAGERPRMGLLRASLNLEFLPFWAAFLDELGYEPVVSENVPAAVVQQSSCGLPAETCLPMKAAAAHAKALLDKGVEQIFLPAVLECPPRGEDDQSHTCFYVQQLPYMLRAGWQTRLITAQFAMRDGVMGLVEPALALAEAFGRPVDSVWRALIKARAAHARFVAARQQLGKNTLASSFQRAAVVLGRPYNTHDPYLNLGIAHHLEKLGLPAIPWDLLPLDEVRLDARWQTVPWHYNREQLRAVEVIRRDARLFPILISSYGCGPDGFIAKHLEELLSGRPRLFLEFDEHRGEAGLVTRLEAFADEIEEHFSKSGTHEHSWRVTPGPRPTPAGRHFFIPRFSEHAHIYAATLRSAGHRAVVLPPPDDDSVRLGERCASGRECHPYAILAGDLVRWVKNSPPDGDNVFLIPNCTSPCLVRQYGDGFRILLDRNGLPKTEIWEATNAQLARVVGIPGMFRLYTGLLATDFLFTLATRLRPYEMHPGSVQELLAASVERLSRVVAEKGNIDEVLTEAALDLWAAPRAGNPGSRPVVGVTGDLYTRMNPTGNAGLFERLMQLGCEVWPSPFFATMADLASALETRSEVLQGRLRSAAIDGLTQALTSDARRKLTRRLPREVVDFAVEPPADDLIRLAHRYVGPRTNHLIVLTVAKMVDFLRRGAAGVINASGINCAVGTVSAAAVSAIRADFGNAPIINLVYGNGEGPTQRIRLETFAHQVQRHRRQVAA